MVQRNNTEDQHPIVNANSLHLPQLNCIPLRTPSKGTQRMEHKANSSYPGAGRGMEYGWALLESHMSPNFKIGGRMDRSCKSNEAGVSILSVTMLGTELIVSARCHQNHSHFNPLISKGLFISTQLNSLVLCAEINILSSVTIWSNKYKKKEIRFCHVQVLATVHESELLILEKTKIQHCSDLFCGYKFIKQP